MHQRAASVLHGWWHAFCGALYSAIFTILYTLYSTCLGRGIHLLGLRWRKWRRAEPHTDWEVDHVGPMSELSTCDVHALPILGSNYAYLIVDRETRQAAVVDPADPEAVNEAVLAVGCTLSCALTTHHHHDHAGGNLELRKDHPGLSIYAGAGETVPGATHVLEDGGWLQMGRTRILMRDAPFHTQGHVVWVVVRPETGACAASKGGARRKAPTAAAAAAEVQVLVHGDDHRGWMGGDRADVGGDRYSHETERPDTPPKAAKPPHGSKPSPAAPAQPFGRARTSPPSRASSPPVPATGWPLGGEGKQKGGHFRSRSGSPTGWTPLGGGRRGHRGTRTWAVAPSPPGTDERPSLSGGGTRPEAPGGASSGGDANTLPPLGWPFGRQQQPLPPSTDPPPPAPHPCPPPSASLPGTPEGMSPAGSPGSMGLPSPGSAGVAGRIIGQAPPRTDRAEAVFSGDSLFTGCVGRFFEGNAEDAWRCLHGGGVFGELPGSCLLFCGHEVAEDAYKFATWLLPADKAVRAQSDRVARKRRVRAPCVPSTMLEERASNPFLRCAEGAVAAAVVRESHRLAAANRSAGLDPSSPPGAVETLAEMRRLKDTGVYRAEVIR